MSRTLTVLVVVLLATSTIIAPAGAALATESESAWTGVTSPAADELAGLSGYSTPDWVSTYGSDGQPGWLIHYETGEYSSLENWANASDARTIRHNSTSGWALVSAPPSHVLCRVSCISPFSSPLEDRGYIQHIDVDLQAETPTVGALLNESDARAPGGALTAPLPGTWTTEGVAYDSDANRTPLSDVRAATGVDSTAETGAGVTVSVVDTGANVKNGSIYGNGTPESDIRITAARNFISDTSVNTSATHPDWSVVADGNGHGSWVASAVAANTTNDTYDGMAPDASLLVAKALDDDGQGSAADIAAAIEWSEQQGADIISLSLGSPTYSPTLASSIRTALNGNTTLVVIAVGNSRMNPATRYIASPADVPEDGVIGVAATNTSGPQTAQSAYFSNVGPDGSRDMSNGVTAGEGPDIAAPGMAVIAPVANANGVRSNESLSGTSMATPIVSGISALMLANDAALVNDTTAARERLLDGASPMPEAGVSEVGNGLVNASNSLRDVEPARSQRDVRSDDAEGRDAFNDAYSGSRAVQFAAATREEIGV